MSVSVIAYQSAVRQPYYALCFQPESQFLLYLLPVHWLVAVRCHQATLCCKHRPPAIALYRATLQHKIIIVCKARGTFLLCVEGAILMQRARYFVVKRCLKFLSPTIKAEVQHRQFAVSRAQRYRSMVSRPCIVCLAITDIHPRHLFCRKSAAQLRPHPYRVRCSYHHSLMTCYGIHHLHVSICYFIQVRSPVSSLVRPCQHHQALWFPFCGQG